MEVFRLARKKYSKELSGKGAAIKGARWNSIGTELIYTASNRSLAMAEVAVHLSLGTLPDDYMMLTIYIPDSLPISHLKPEDLPSTWNMFPHQKSTQTFGDEFVRNGEGCILRVPSVVTSGDFNYLISPYHQDFSKVSIIDETPFPFDRRIFAD